MGSNINRSYRFSFFTALWITGLLTFWVAIFEAYFFTFNGGSLFVFALVSLSVSFVIVQFRVEHFIYRRIKQLYKKISLLASTPLEKEPVTTDMEELTQNVEQFAEQKKLEIEALKIRENYRREFIGNVSHELKTPLFTIEGYILTLLDGALHDEEQAEKFLNRAHKGVERLVYIVNDLDMITKLEAGDLHLDWQCFDIRSVIEAVFDLMEMKAERKNISLSLDHPYGQPLWVKADRERIRQVLTNLVVNSIKYGKEKGTTEIGIEQLTNRKYLIRVTDNGKGFKEEDIPRLFERFYRVDKSGSRQEGGSGLGLAIVKHILEAHKEKIYVESDYGVGSEFSFTLEKGEKPT